MLYQLEKMVWIVLAIFCVQHNLLYNTRLQQYSSCKCGDGGLGLLQDNSEYTDIDSVT